MIVKVRNHSNPEKGLAWAYFPTTKLEVVEISREEARVTAYGDDQQSVAQPPHGLDWCLKEATDEPPVVNMIYVYPKEHEGCGLVFAEFGSIFIMNDNGKTIEKI